MNSEYTQFELIKLRKSERNFSSKDIDNGELQSIIKDINNFKGPFEDSIRVELIVNDKNSSTNDEKLGTYGVIKGAKYYLATIADRKKESLFELGYVLEKAILYLLEKNLGTCWLGGTFKRSQFGEKLSFSGDEYLPIVIPFGYMKEKKSITDRVVRLVASSDKRKSWDELFFDESIENPLSRDASGEYEKAFEAVRLGPSASNKQPWRIIKTRDGFEFYLKPTQGYSDKLSYNIQEVDIGIAMCHFELVAKEEGSDGCWEIGLEDTLNKDDLIHVATWKIS